MNQVAIIAALSNLLVEATDKCEKLESDLQLAQNDLAYCKSDCDDYRQNVFDLQERLETAHRQLDDHSSGRSFNQTRLEDQNKILMSLFSRPEVFVNIRTYMETADLSPSKKIPNIKAIRTLTGWGLKEAKDFVEAFKFSAPELPIQKTIGEIIKEKLGESK